MPSCGLLVYFSSHLCEVSVTKLNNYQQDMRQQVQPGAVELCRTNACGTVTNMLGHPQQQRAWRLTTSEDQPQSPKALNPANREVCGENSVTKKGCLSSQESQGLKDHYSGV